MREGETFVATKARVAAFRATLSPYDVSVDEAEDAIRASTTPEAWRSADVAVDGALRAIAGDEYLYLHEAVRRFLRDRVEVAITAVLFTPADA